MSIKNLSINESFTESVYSAEADKSEYPEGGRGWLVIVGVFCMSAMTYGMINSYGVYDTYYANSFPNSSSMTLNWIGSLQTFLCYFVAPLSFPLVPVLSPRITTCTGGFLMMTSFFLLSLCNKIWQIYLCQGIMYGVGAGFCFASSLLAPYEWFKKRRALAIGLSVSGTSVGGVISTLILKNMIPKYGFKLANIAIGLFYIPLVLTSTFLVQQKMPEKYLNNKHDFIANAKPSLLGVRSLPQRYRDMLKEWQEVSKNVNLRILLISNMFGMLGSYPSIFYIDYYASLIAPKTRFATYSIIIWNACGGLGRVMSTYLADRFGRLNVLILAILISAVLPLAMWLSSQYAGKILYGIFISLYSISCAGFFSIFPATIGQIFGIRQSESRVNLFSITSSVGPVIGGVIASSFIPSGSQSSSSKINAFNKLFIYTSCVMFASCCLLTLLKIRLNKKWIAFV